MPHNLDKELIFLYAENARIKIQELAQMLRKSPPRIKYNLKVIEQQQIIYNPHSIIDYSFFGLHLFRIYFQGGYVGEKDKAAIVQTLSQHPYVVSIYELSGQFDLAIEMVSPNASRFNKELKKLITQLPTLNNYKIVLNIVTHIYPRLYLVKNSSILAELLVNKANKDLIIGGDRPLETFSEEELAILHYLLKKPKIRLTQLAKVSNLNIKTALNILNNLQKRLIIKGYKHIIDTNALGITKHRLFLKLHNVAQEREDALREYLLHTPEIVQVNKTVGDWDVEVDVESLDKSKIRQLIIQLREDFKDLIENFNSLEFYQYHKKSFLPEYLFQGE
ncbi:Lrp/AsnC family transcriptional regulator [Candidatus Woesearchaeota archaeon]|nr:Lrp/AsnC family transcriptional regulator [Candidatus Woesearchaeota archaeon]